MPKMRQEPTSRRQCRVTAKAWPLLARRVSNTAQPTVKPRSKGAMRAVVAGCSSPLSHTMGELGGMKTGWEGRVLFVIGQRAVGAVRRKRGLPPTMSAHPERMKECPATSSVWQLFWIHCWSRKMSARLFKCHRPCGINAVINPPQKYCAVSWLSL